jgi:hypothetical protein
VHVDSRSYDYALQVLKAQQQFAHSMLAAAEPMLNVARDIMSADTTQDRSANKQLDDRSDPRHEGSRGSRKNERYNDDDSAEYNRSDDDTSDTSRTPRANTQTEESAKTRARVTANSTGRKLP